MRGRETAARLQPSLGLLPAVLGLAFLWLICARAGIQTAEALLLPLVLWVAIRASFGAAVGRASVFPCAFLVLAIPVWDPLERSRCSPSPRARLPRSSHSRRCRRALREISSRSMPVRSKWLPGCSGLGMLLVGLAIAGLYGEMQRQPASRRLTLFVLVAALSVVANWIRVAGIVYAGYLKGMNTSLVRDHYGFGWVVFAVMLLGFFPLARRLANAPEAPGFPADARVYPRSALGGAALILAALAIGPAWQLAADWREPPQVTANLPQDPTATWTGPRSCAAGLGAAVSRRRCAAHRRLRA